MTLARLPAAICVLALSAGVASCTGNSGTPSGVATLEARFSQCELRQSAPRCYAPQQIRRSYEVQGLLDSGVTGRGERVVIVENASPSLRHDVHEYDQIVGLDDPLLTVVQPFGATRSDEDSEDVLDVETVHSIAPGAGTTEEVSGGGTSLGAPSWAGIVALADQRAGHRLGFINAALYRIASGPAYRTAFHDIIQGDNTLRLDVGSTVLVVPGYVAGPGWDPVTGLGSPKATELAAALPASLRPTDGAGL